ncbi:MAG TPA: helix-turn-helix transcriptional regulator [Phycisphaerales bacterium]|nr:helix-turn-helix transcriptional regulator [Phycisphaerales bacterium]
MPRRSSIADTQPVVLPLDAQTWDAVVVQLGLAPQQERVVRLIVCGARDKRIASELGLKLPTVRTYLDRIYRRVGVRDRLELVVKVFTTAHALRGPAQPGQRPE